VAEARAIDEQQIRIEFARDLSLFDATMIGVGAMIGAGIFVLTGFAINEAGPAAIHAGEVYVVDQDLPSPGRHTVLVPIHNPETVDNLATLGAVIAKANRGEVVLLSIAEVPIQLPRQRGRGPGARPAARRCGSPSSRARRC
jgi:hypothetical protein